MGRRARLFVHEGGLNSSLVHRVGEDVLAERGLERLEHFDGNWHNERRVLLSGDVRYRLEIAQLVGDRVTSYDLSGLSETLGCLKLTLGIDDLGPALSFCLSTLRHCALHFDGKVDVLDLDEVHLDTPRIRQVIDDPLQFLVEPVALAQNVIELDLGQHRPQGCLRNLRCSEEVILNLDDGLDRFEHLEVDDRVDSNGHVVARDDVLWRHVESHYLKIDLHHPIHDGNEEEQSGPFGPLEHSSQPEDHTTLVLLDDANRRRQQNQQKYDHRSGDH